MLDISTEQLIALKDVAKRIPGRGGRPTNFATVWRWIIKGSKAKGANGDRVRLRAARIGGKWVTSLEAVQEFLEALTPPFPDESSRLARSNLPRSATKRQKADERTNKRLEAAGL